MRLQADGSKRRWPFNLTGMPQGRTKLLDSRLVGKPEVIEVWRSKLTHAQIHFPDPALQ